MKRNSIRLLFLLTLVASLGIRHQVIRDWEDKFVHQDMTTAITSLVETSGLTVLENPVRPPKVLSRIVYFQRSLCDHASLAMPFRLRVDAETMFARLKKRGYVKRVRYFDQEWGGQDRVALFSQWIKHSVLSVFRETPYLPINQAILIADPPDCGGTDPVDWKLAWDRTRFEEPPSPLTTALMTAGPE